MTFVLTGLDIGAKADLTVRSLSDALGGTGQFAEFDARLVRSDKADAPTNVEATAQLRVTVKDEDADRVGRRFSGAATELALAGYPGLHLTAPPGDATAYGVYWPTLVPAALVLPSVVHADGSRVDVPHHGDRADGPPPVVDAAVDASLSPGVPEAPDAVPSARAHRTPTDASTARLPLGTLIGARSGDKGGNANVGLWARSDEAWLWLDAELTLDRFRDLLPEARGLTVQRHAFPNLRRGQLRGRRTAGRRRGLLHPTRPPGQGAGRVPPESVGRHPDQTAARVVVVLGPVGRGSTAGRAPPIPTTDRTRAQEAPMDFTESDELQMLRDAVGSIAAKFGHDYYVAKAHADERTDELWNAVAEQGFLGVNVPEEYGGGGGGITELAAVAEELAAAGCPLLVIVVSPAICATIIAKFGTEAAEAAVAPPLRHGRAQDGLRHHGAGRRLQLPQPRPDGHARR